MKEKTRMGGTLHCVHDSDEITKMVLDDADLPHSWGKYDCPDEETTKFNDCQGFYIEGDNGKSYFILDSEWKKFVDTHYESMDIGVSVSFEPYKLKIKGLAARNIQTVSLDG
jgi:hypothetical protein